MGKIKYRDVPCPGTACNWPYAGFHICLNLPLEVMRRVEDGRARRSPSVITGKKSEKKSKSRPSGQLHVGDPKRVERNSNIIRLYSQEELTMREIAIKLDVDQTTVMRVLHTAADRGDVVIRRAVRRSTRI